jgi:hypothetical protein
MITTKEKDSEKKSKSKMSLEQPEIHITSSIQQEHQKSSSDETTIHLDNDDTHYNHANLVNNIKDINSAVKVVPSNDTNSITTTNKTGSILITDTGITHSLRSSEDTTTTTTIMDSNNSNVSFGTVHVHEHRMTLGRNPGVGHGVPVELSWDVEGSNVFNTIDEYEENTRSQSHLNYHHRTITPPPQSQSQQQQNENENDTTTIDNHHYVSEGNETVTNVNISIDDSNTTHIRTPSSPTTSIRPTITDITTIKTPSKRFVQRIPASKREAIASQRHSRDSITRVENEMKIIQQHRTDSKSDVLAKQIVQGIQRSPDSIINTILQQHQEQKEQQSSLKNTTTTTKQKSWWSYCCPL